MRFKEFNLSESLLFQAAKDQKYYPIINDLIDQGHEFQIGKEGDLGTFVFDKGQKVSFNTQILNGKGTKKNEEGEEEEITQLKANQLYKHPDIIRAAGGRASVSTKEKLLLKPSDIFPDGQFSAQKVFDAVIQNKVLKSTDYGKFVIDIAKQIQQGKEPDISAVPTEFQKAIRDFAGEYLGVLALLNNTANFPSRAQFFEHLGVSNLNDIELYFPAKTNNPLADSIAKGQFKNKKTGNAILVSSKGDKGAAPSVDNLKIPENLANSNEYRLETGFIKTLQEEGTAFSQPFYAINYLYRNFPQSISSEIVQALPFDESEIKEVRDWFNKKLPLSAYKKIDKKYKPILKLSETKNPKAPIGGVIQYTLKSELKRLINSEKILPNFESLAREILQTNFIQIFADIKSNKLVFEVLWPNKEMASGVITIESKYGIGQSAQGKMSFNVGRK